MCDGRIRASGRTARDARAGRGHRAGDRAHAAIAAGAKEIKQATELQRQLAREDVAEIQLGVGVREVDPPIPGDVACRQRERVGGGPAAEESCKEGEEDPEDGVQTHVSHRAVGAGMGRALCPAVGEILHSVSLHQ